jgi:putative copper export protein
MDWLYLISRWLHITAAVAGLGGIFFLVLVLVPALRQVPEAGPVADAARHRFKRVAHTAIGLLLLTGIYNYLVVAAPKIQAAGIGKSYHPVIGAKILLALVFFTISLLLLKPVPAMHAQRARWLGVNAVLGLIILLLGAYLRRLWP